MSRSQTEDGRTEPTDEDQGGDSKSRQDDSDGSSGSDEPPRRKVDKGKRRADPEPMDIDDGFPAFEELDRQGSTAPRHRKSTAAADAVPVVKPPQLTGK